MSLRLGRDTQDLLLRYIALLVKWNQTYNLTAVHGPEQMVVRHLLDSLSLIPYVRGPRVVDVGTGAGLPGIPLALVFPEYQVVLLDSQAKKIRFVTQVTAELGITNVAIAHTRVQDYHPSQGFDTVVSRAFATLAEFISASSHLCQAGGCMLAMKGKFPVKELEEIRQPNRVINVIPANIPGLEAERHIVQIAY